LILPGPEFKPVTSRVAGWRCPCILSHLSQMKLYMIQLRISSFAKKGKIRVSNFH
jgi:hypothetical protein